jgi:hypothetical protein
VSVVFMCAFMATAQEQGATPAPPQEQCEYDGSGGNETLRRVLGKEPAPSFFACQTHNPNAGPSGCIASTVPAGLVVSVKREVNGWTCIHSDGFVSGWISSTRLEQLATEPKPPIADWLGWWRNGPGTPSERNDRLLITRGKEPGSLHVSGRAYWYGMNGNVHSGGVNAEAVPVGRHLHVVNGCVVDLDLSRDEKGLKLLASDNEECGGMNVRFMGEWRKFVPKQSRAKSHT